MTPRMATFLMFVVNGAVVGTWVAHIPGIQERLAITPDQLGLILFCAPLGALVAQQVTGQLLMRVSSRLVLTVAAVALPLVLVLPLMASSPLTLAFALFLFGYANTSMDVSMNAHGVALETAGGTSIFSRLHAGWSLGGIIAPIWVAIAVSLDVDAVVEVMLTVFVMLLIVVVAIRSLATGSVKTAGTRGIHLPTLKILPIAVLLGLVAFVEAVLSDWGGVYLRQGVDAEAGVAVLAFAALSLGLFIGRIGGDWAKDRIGAARLLQGGMLLTALAMVVFLVVGGAAVGLVGLVVAGIGIANAIPQLLAAAGRIPPHGPSLSAAFTFLTLAFMISGPVIGSVASAFSITVAFGLLVVASVLVVIITPRVPAAETNPRFTRHRSGFSAGPSNGAPP